MSPDSVFGTNCTVNDGRGKRFFSSPKHLDLFSDPPILLFHW